ncbi:MAG: protein-glutamate O-methyltransferase CheR [Candidatus Wallbacteria bacterium]
MNSVALEDDEFRLISKLVYDKFGIKLSDQKKTLVIERLQKILRTGGFFSFKDYYEYILKEPTGTAILTFIDKISTHHTFFFRESEHFEFLKNIGFPELTNAIRAQGRKEIKIWCAGCSSGEEPYSLAMIANDYFKESAPGFEVSILATDISVTSIEKAESGIYPAQSVMQIPTLLRQKYFHSLGDGNFSIKKHLKDLILFRRLNLMRDSYPFKGKFDIIFCRNVMIYFDAPTRQKLIERYSRYTENHGYLMIGHSESIDRSCPFYKYIKPAIYKKISG